MSTIGTEGDDVIVAPIGTSGSVQGLGETTGSASWTA
jgi:hypothetical protein